MSASPEVLVRGLTRSFGDLVAIDDISFQVTPGELFGIVGPDGAGKTTTLRILAGVLRPSSGQGVVHGVDVAEDPEGVKPHIAYMSQQFGLYQDLSVRENIDFYADLYRVPRRTRRQRLDRLYAFSNLGPFEKRLAGNLSGGMKQKLSLCCALIHQPRVLFLDEPTFGVDPISRRDLWLILHEMYRRVSRWWFPPPTWMRRNDATAWLFSTPGSSWRWTLPRPSWASCREACSRWSAPNPGRRGISSGDFPGC
jgi:ABC-2 type transport system ATP-binding protein